MKSCPNCRTKVDSTFTLHCPECGTSIDPSVGSMTVPQAQPASSSPAAEAMHYSRRSAGVGMFFRGIGLRMLVAGVVLGGSAFWGAFTGDGASGADLQEVGFLETASEDRANASEDRANASEDRINASEDRVNASELAIGDCMMWPGGEDSFFSLERRACDTPHDAEMFALVDYPADADAEYPGDDPISEWSVQACYEEFASYLGQTYEDAENLDFTFFTPTETGWRKYDDRTVQCVVYHMDESVMLGSVRGGA